MIGHSVTTRKLQVGGIKQWVEWQYFLVKAEVYVFFYVKNIIFLYNINWHLSLIHY